MKMGWCCRKDLELNFVYTTDGWAEGEDVMPCCLNICLEGDGESIFSKFYNYCDIA
jgi:hypothetical protein